MPHTVRRFPRAQLAAAVAPARLGPTLDALLAAGLIDEWSETGGEIVLRGDWSGLEARSEFAEQSQAHIEKPSTMKATDAERMRDSVRNRRQGSGLVDFAGEPKGLRGKRTKLADARAEYFATCNAFISTSAFRRLTARQRAIWRLHSRGLSWVAIAKRLGVSLQQVRIALGAVRKAAKLPATTSCMPRGGGCGRPPRPDKKRPRCECGRLARAKGLCMPHYLRRWRQQRETGT